MANPYYGRSKEWLEARLLEAQEEQAGGKILTSASAGDVSSGFEARTGPATRIKQLLRALNRVDPVGYPLSEVGTRSATRAIFPLINDRSSETVQNS